MLYVAEQLMLVGIQVQAVQIGAFHDCAGVHVIDAQGLQSLPRHLG
jgi:hypothetical protein